MLKRPTQKNLSSDEIGSIITASAQQTGKSQRLRTYDPNFPLFEVPVNKKLLIYVPNHTVMNADGVVDIRKDKFAAHMTVKGRDFNTIRCSGGVVSDSLGLNGSCPFCDAAVPVWDLYNAEYKEMAKIKGIDPDSPEAKDGLKQVRIDLLNKRSVLPAEVWYTFPIVVIDCEEQNGKATVIPKKDAEGRISGKTFWYSIREKTYLDKWVKSLETAPTDNDIPPTNPAGLWAILNFEYESKDGTHDKMHSAKALAVGYKKMADSYVEWEKYFDQITEEWTPAKAIETLVDNALRDGAEQTEACDEIMKPVYDKLSMLKLGNGVGTSVKEVGSTDANSALASFGVTEAQSVPNIPQVNSVPQVGVN